MQKVLSRVLPAIKPAPEEMSKEVGFAQMLVSHISENAPNGCQVVLTGSVAKRTFLRDKRDIDIFVLFPRSVPKETLEAHIKGIMDSAFPTVHYQLSYAEHPYSRFHFEGRRIDLVPAYQITKAAERISAVDRSVLHTDFVNTKLKKGQVDDVLLLKQFLRSNGIYGAEIKIEGFSGYLCELLIIKYGGFAALLKAAAKWKIPKTGGIFIDLQKTYKPKEAKEAFKRFGSQFIVIDPTDRNRNVSAAVSPENLAYFISLGKAFLKKPSEAQFFKRPESFEEKVDRAAKGSKVITVSMPRPDIVDDILWGQLHKLCGQLEAHMKEYGPKRIIPDDTRHLVRLAFVLERDTLPKTMLVSGPPLSMKKHVEQFKKSHRNGKFVTKQKKIFAQVRRPVTKAEDALHQFFRGFAHTRSHLAYPEEMLIIEKG